MCLYSTLCFVLCRLLLVAVQFQGGSEHKKVSVVSICVECVNGAKCTTISTKVDHVIYPPSQALRRRWWC